MNYLAHCLIGERAAAETHLAAALVAGGFLGDFIKGTVPAAMPDALALGVRLHRRVDAYSNRHPVIRTSAERFPPELRRFAPILVDVVCDHLLARYWAEYHPADLEAFTRRVYRDVAEHQHWLPVAGQRFLSYARERDLLRHYADWSVTAAALRSITRRLQRSDLDPLLETSIPPLLGDLEVDFRDYLPDIVEHAGRWVDEEWKRPAASTANVRPGSGRPRRS